MNGRPPPRHTQGFTLIELLIAIAVVAILAAIAYPTYTEHTKKTRRSEIAGVLVEEAQRLERFLFPRRAILRHGRTTRSGT